MKNISFVEIGDNKDLICKVMDLVYEEWGDSFHSSKEEKIEKLLKYAKSGEKYPKSFVLLEDDELVGSFCIKENDFRAENLNPWLACVVVKKEKRGMGYGRILLEKIKQVIDEMKIKSIYLTTMHNGFYEKIGFKFMRFVNKDGKIQRLYEYNN